VIAVLRPDEEVPGTMGRDRPAACSRPVTVVFAHGFNLLLWRARAAGRGRRGAWCRPRGPGRMLRERYVAASACPVSRRRLRDASGSAWARAESYAAAAARPPEARLWEDHTVAEEDRGGSLW
jgi:ketol-acid reductoisomerase